MAVLRLVLVSALVLTTLMMLACASSSVNLSQGAKQNLAGVSISNNVILPEQPLFSGPSTAFGDIGVTVKSSNDQSKTIVNYLLENNINISSIVKESFIKQAGLNPILAGKIQPGSDTVIELEVLMYGIGHKKGLANVYKPMLSIVARMRDSADNIIWEQYDFVTVIGGDSPARTLEQYFSSPDVFRLAFKSAADNVSTQLLEDLY